MATKFNATSVPLKRSGLERTRDYIFSVRRSRAWEEWQVLVRTRQTNKFVFDATYHTDDLQDAEETCWQMAEDQRDREHPVEGERTNRAGPCRGCNELTFWQVPDDDSGRVFLCKTCVRSEDLGISCSCGHCDHI